MSRDKQQQKLNSVEKITPTTNVESVKVQMETPRPEHSFKFDPIIHSPPKINLKEAPVLKDTATKSSPKFVENERAKFVDNDKAKFVDAPKVSVRHVPIRLDDGKVIQRDPDEKVEIR